MSTTSKRGSSIRDDERRVRLNRRLRRAFVEGAEEDSLRRLGRTLTREELQLVVWHYPGDVVARGGPCPLDSSGASD